MTRGRVKDIVLVWLVAAVVALAAIAIVSWLKLSSFQYQTCVVQARGLPAGHEQAAAVGDEQQLITWLLSLPPAPHAAPTPPNIEALVVGLDRHLAKYLKLEAAQPPSRSCS